MAVLIDLVWENWVDVIGLIFSFSFLIIKDSFLKIDAPSHLYLGLFKNFSKPISQRYLPETDAPARVISFLSS